MLRLYFSKDWNPYFKKAAGRIKKNRIESEVLVEELTDIYAGKKLVHHVKRLGAPAINEKGVKLLNEMGFTLEEVERKLPFLEVRLENGQNSTVRKIMEDYRKTNNPAVLSVLRELKRENFSYSTKPGAEAETMELNSYWFELKGYTMVGEHGVVNGQYTNFDSFSVFTYTSTKGEVVAINIQDGITRSKNGLESSNNVNQCVKKYNSTYNWAKVLRDLTNGKLALNDYIYGLRDALIKERETDIDATTLSVVVLIHVKAKEKTYVLGNMICGNSPIIKVSRDKKVEILTDDLFQLKLEGVLSLPDVLTYIEKRRMILTEAVKGDTIATGSDGVLFMSNLLKMLRMNKKIPNDPSLLYKATGDDATIVCVKITK